MESLKENQFSPYPGHGGRPTDVVKLLGNGEEVHDVRKRKDVFRPSILDAESGRRDRWHDEERDTNYSIRRDRWREGDKELGDNRKTDRWTENSVGRQFGEVRRAPPERWTNSSNKDTNNDRRDTKWNTCWGPDDKESDSLHKNWLDSGKDATEVTQEEPAELMAFCTPSSEEIDKGDILSSGVPQGSKDGSGGYTPSRGIRLDTAKKQRRYTH
ncbi:protein ESSENTIAL FOR POTEXVIRUS ACCUMULATION 1-like isoform X2 [Apium graveolens]|uniref:protein ESSENTIAL FOR POTEXVIRUS ACCUMULATION 1-like isoform X2 n=1 Tax=Apium graveolens TaxID=4045 RepID=UPI003D7A827D